MPATISPGEQANRCRRWAETQFDGSVVVGLQLALQVDRRESQSRAPRRTGALAGTIRVTNPSVKRALKTGSVVVSLTAGSRKKGHPVWYASVLQRGLVGWPGSPTTKPHRIAKTTGGQWYVTWGRGRGYGGRQGTGQNLAFVAGGQMLFRGSVQHPGSRFNAVGYLKVNEPRARESVGTFVANIAVRAMGDGEFPMQPVGGS